MIFYQFFKDITACINLSCLYQIALTVFRPVLFFAGKRGVASVSDLQIKYIKNKLLQTIKKVKYE